jgi:DNA polymerase-3 subunit epsilon
MSINRHVALDTETTGFDPKRGDKLVEIACLELINDRPSGETFHVYINPQRTVPESAFKVHGLSTEFLADKPLFGDVAQGFLDFVQDSPLIIHNAPFDMKFLNAELHNHDHARLSFDRVIDTLKIARQTFPGSPASLDALCRRFKIDLSARDKHGALIDTELLAEVYFELIGGRTPVFNLDESTKKEGYKSKDASETTYPKRTFSVSQAEKAAHKAFVHDKMTDDALWKKTDSAYAKDDDTTD